MHKCDVSLLFVIFDLPKNHVKWCQCQHAFNNFYFLMSPCQTIAASFSLHCYCQFLVHLFHTFSMQKHLSLLKERQKWLSSIAHSWEQGPSIRGRPALAYSPSYSFGALAYYSLQEIQREKQFINEKRKESFVCRHVCSWVHSWIGL